jgi:ribosomal-protein-alanine N-acetyltransferase
MHQDPNQALPALKPAQLGESGRLFGDDAFFFSVRPMEERDLSQVQAIDQMSFSLPWPASAYRYELFHNLNSIQHVAESGQPKPRVVAMIVVWVILDEAHIATLAVHPDYRQHGIARQLIFSALQSAFQKGARQATLEVRSGNQAAISLYKGLEFEIVGNRPRYYKDNQEDALIMTVSSLDDGYLNRLQSIAHRR